MPAQWAQMTQPWLKALRFIQILPRLHALTAIHASRYFHYVRHAKALCCVALLSMACALSLAPVAWGQSISTQHLIASYDHMTLTSGSKSIKNDCMQDFEGRPATLVYVWSPRMVLSALHADVAQQQALAAGLAFMPLHDARLGAEPAGQVDPPELAQAMQRLRQTQPSAAAALQHSIALCSAQLLQNQAQRHFPTAFVWNGSAFAQYPIVGAMPAAYWAQSITQRLQGSAADSAVANQLHAPPAATVKQGVHP